MASGVAACIARMRSSECGRRELRMTTAVGAYTRTEKPPPPPPPSLSGNGAIICIMRFGGTYGTLMACLACAVK